MGQPNQYPFGFHPLAAGSAPVRQLSPGFFQGGPPNQPNTYDCAADRVIPAGGALASHFLHPDAVPFSRSERIVPSSGMYTASKNRPVTAIAIAFTVPFGMTLALCGAAIAPFAFDALAPGDAVPLQEGRLSSSLGYDLTFSTAGRMGNIQAGLIPRMATVGQPLSQQQFPSLPAPSVGFAPLPGRATNGQSSVELATAYGILSFQPQLAATPSIGSPVDPSQFVLGAAAGGTLQPQTQDPKQGPEDMPFTYFVHESESVSMAAVAFGPIRIPLAFLEAKLVGYLMPKTNLAALMDRMRPCG